MKEDKKAKSPWPSIIIGVIIVALFYMWVFQRNENEQAKQEFAMQTARAYSEEVVSIRATQEIENKIKDCVDPNKVPRVSGTYVCVVGFISHDKQIMKSDPSEPDFYLTYFGYEPNTFYLYGDENLVRYINRCVMVWGKINVDPDGTPAINITALFSDINIEELPEGACHR
jgi:hypothetical protein